MRIRKVHCFFEQSGTFKNEFIKLGVQAEDYDILNDFGQTDNIVDLFKEIRGGYAGDKSIFDNIKSDELIFAFFPCVRFSIQSILCISCRGSEQAKWETTKKLDYTMQFQREITEMYELVSMLASICIKRNIPLIIENPYHADHYLTKYWCIPTSIIDHDRTKNGDLYKKPTQYWFIGIEPKKNFIFEPIEQVELKKISSERNQVKRSLIHPQYASRFIRQHILDGEK